MGYIVGLNVGIVVVSGSILTWHIAIPIYQAFFMNTDPALAASVAAASSTEAAFAIWGAKMRYLGVGAMLIGGIWTLISLRKSLLNGVKSGFAAARKRWPGAGAHRARPADEVDAGRPGGVRAALLACTRPSSASGTCPSR